MPNGMEDREKVCSILLEGLDKNGWVVIKEKRAQGHGEAIEIDLKDLTSKFKRLRFVHKVRWT